MRGARPSTTVPWVAFAACFLWTVYSHREIRKLVQDETSNAARRISLDIRALDRDTTGGRSARVGLLEEVPVGVLLQNTSDSTGAVEAATDYEELFYHEPFGGISDATHTRDSDPKVWLYSLITTDYDGPKLTPHFVRHYSDVGVQAGMMYVDLLHDPALPDDGLLEARAQFENIGAHTRTILHHYTPDLQDLAMVTGLNQMPTDPEDWVIVADMDEYFTFGSSVQDAVQAMEEEGATFALGEMLDHVATGGVLKRVSTATDIWSQFPLVCPIVSTIAKGLPAKVTIHKAYLRSGAGHHHIVEPYLAEAYFGKQCEGVECELVLKRYKQRTTRDVFAFTPYKQHAEMYADSTVSPGWQARRWLTWSKVHHFKWHAAVLDNLHSRMVRDSGNCLLGVNEDDCQPVFQFWQEVARQFHKLNATQSINITDLDCKEGADTLWNW